MPDRLRGTLPVMFVLAVLVALGVGLLRAAGWGSLVVGAAMGVLMSQVPRLTAAILEWRSRRAQKP